MDNLFIVYFKDETYLVKASDFAGARAKLHEYAGYAESEMTVIESTMPSGDVMLIRKT